jgi:hypothetical protein
MFRVDVVTRQTRWHSPRRVAWTPQTWRHSPSHVAQTRQTRRHSPSRVARTRQTRERQVWQVLCEFSESGESGKFGECRLDAYKICYLCLKRPILSCALVPSRVARTRQTRWHLLSCVARTRQTCRHSLSRAARTRQTRGHSLSRIARTRQTRQTRQHSPSRVARTRQTRRHSPKAIFEKHVTRLDKFVWVTRESREFGASGHTLSKMQEEK